MKKLRIISGISTVLLVTVITCACTHIQKDHIKETENKYQHNEQFVSEDAVSQTQFTYNSNVLFDNNIMLFGYLDGYAIAEQNNEIIAFDNGGTIKYCTELPQNSMITGVEILNNKLAIKITYDLAKTEINTDTERFSEIEINSTENKLLIYDEQLNLINETELNYINDFSLLSVSPDGQKIVYTKEIADTIYIADINGNNEHILYSLNGKAGEPVIFLNLAFTDFGVVYSAKGTVKLSEFNSDMYYGVIDLNGNNQYTRDDGVGSLFQRFNSGVFIPDRNVPYEQESTGIVRIINNNTFTTMSTHIKNQSQGAIISQDGKKIITQIIDWKNNFAEITVYNIQDGNIICTYKEDYINNIVWMISDGNNLLVSYNLPDNSMKTVSYAV